MEGTRPIPSSSILVGPIRGIVRSSVKQWRCGLSDCPQADCPRNYINCYASIGGVEWLPALEYLSSTATTTQNYERDGLCASVKMMTTLIIIIFTAFPWVFHHHFHCLSLGFHCLPVPETVAVLIRTRSCIMRPTASSVLLGGCRLASVNDVNQRCESKNPTGLTLYRPRRLQVQQAQAWMLIVVEHLFFFVYMAAKMSIPEKPVGQCTA